MATIRVIMIPGIGRDRDALRLATRQKEFSFGVQRADGTLRLFWCTEKQHFIEHWASNLRTVTTR